MDVLSNILYFSVYLKYFTVSQKRSENKTKKGEVFFVAFLPFWGNKIVQSSDGNMDFFPSTEISV